MTTTNCMYINSGSKMHCCIGHPHAHDWGKLWCFVSEVCVSHRGAPLPLCGISGTAGTDPNCYRRLPDSAEPQPVCAVWRRPEEAPARNTQTPQRTASSERNSEPRHSAASLKHRWGQKWCFSYDKYIKLFHMIKADFWCILPFESIYIYALGRCFYLKEFKLHWLHTFLSVHACSFGWESNLWSWRCERYAFTVWASGKHSEWVLFHTSSV